MRRLLSITAALASIASIAFMPACGKSPSDPPGQETSPPPTPPPEYFGKFLDKLKGELVADAKPRSFFRVDADFRFEDPNGLLWLTPGGTEVDGASIPRFLWSIIGAPFEGAYVNASVIHDHYCRTMERTAHDTHRDFYYGMRASKVPDSMARLMHWAVSLFGPDWKIEKTDSSLESKRVPLPAIDLSDPDVLAAAISKTHAVGRTLLTSNGKILDVTAEGQVNASDETVQESADKYREVFASKEFSSSPARLGLLSQATTLTDVPPWAGNRIPTLREAIVLAPENLPKANEPFKLEPRSRDLIRGRIDLRKIQREATTVKRNTVVSQ